MAANTFTQKIKVKLDGADKASKGANKVSKSMGGLAKSALAAGAAYFGARGIINGVRSAVDAFAVQERAEKALETALGRTSTKLLAQASALQKVTMFGDEATIQQMAFLGSIGMTEQQISKILPVAMDLATATGMTLESAVRNTAKTFSGLAGELGELVPQLRDLTAEEMKAGKAVEVMADLFGGQATDAADTLDGKIAQFKNSLGDLMEDIGESFLPILTSMIEGFSSVINTIGGWFDVGLKEQVQAERAEFNEMINTLKRLEPESETRKRLIQEIKKEYPDYLKGLDLEKASFEDINKFQQESNALMMSRLIISMREEEITKALEEQEKAARKLVLAEREMTTARANADKTRKIIEDGEIKLHMKRELAAFPLEERAKKALALAKAEFAAAEDRLNILQNVETAEIKQAKKIIAIKEEKDKKIQESIDLEKAEAEAIEKKNKLLEEQEKLFQKALNYEIPALQIRNQLLENNIEAVSLQAGQQEDELSLTEELAHQHQFLQDTIESGDEPRMKMVALGKVMAASFDVQKDKLDEFSKSHVDAAMAIGAAQMHVGQAAADAAGAFIVAKTQEAIASFIADSFKKFGILGGIIGAGASGVVGSLMSQGIKSVAAAEGMNEVVTEPTIILAGEEGAEYVNIEPTQNEGAGMGNGSQIIFQGNVLSKDFIEDEAIPMIREAVRRGHSLA